MAYKQRLEKLEKGNPQDFSEIRRLIEQGLFFDELSDEQKENYEKYKCSLGGVADDIARAELDMLFNDTPENEAYHFQLTKRQPPPTKEEHAERIKEIERILFDTD